MSWPGPPSPRTCGPSTPPPAASAGAPPGFPSGMRVAWFSLESCSWPRRSSALLIQPPPEMFHVSQV
jgi:hypothetical protein